jgi:hypothetical protein
LKCPTWQELSKVRRRGGDALTRLRKGLLINSSNYITISVSVSETLTQYFLPFKRQTNAAVTCGYAAFAKAEKREVVPYVRQVTSILFPR